ncbi:MAG: 50S ribosomal protein L31 [Candidatus Peribacteria bacterium]|nr:MAG: 50S ribosomal protein L31 [Candidatus Peribacteria bacterium]
MPKSGIHPTYHQGVEVQCICGHQFTLNAAVAGPIKVETCPACHPVYTGKKETKVVKGRMEKFLEKQKKMDALAPKE